MASAVRRLGSLSMARGCARIDAGPDTAKIGSADRVQVHHARLLAVIGVRKTFPHGLDPHRTSTTKVGNRHTCGSPELWGDAGSYELGGVARFRFRLNTHMPSVVANGGIAGGSHEYQANPGSTSRLSQSHRSN